VYATIVSAVLEEFELPTTLVSSTELRARLNTDHWGRKQLFLDFEIETPFGRRSIRRLLDRLAPKITFRDVQLNSVVVIEPARFYANGQYLLKSYDLKPSSDGMRRNPAGFKIEVEDPSKPDLRDASKATISLGSENASYVLLDRINDLKMNSIVDNVKWELDRPQMIAVSDEIDDGAVNCSEGGRFTPDDGKPKDPTIRTFVGGKVTASYFNKLKNINIKRSVDVCPDSLRRRVRMRLVNLAGSGFTDNQIIENLLPVAKAL
jgi:hypothetical protein